MKKKKQRYTVILSYGDGYFGEGSRADTYQAFVAAESVGLAVDRARVRMARDNGNEIIDDEYANAAVVSVFRGWLKDVYDNSRD